MDGACRASQRAPGRYQPRRPSQSVFYRCVQHFHCVVIDGVFKSSRATLPAITRRAVGFPIRTWHRRRAPRWPGAFVRPSFAPRGPCPLLPRSGYHAATRWSGRRIGQLAFQTNARSMGLATHRRTRIQSSHCYQRSRRGPSNVPTAEGIIIPSRYQMPRNGALVSGQCNE